MRLSLTKKPDGCSKLGMIKRCFEPDVRRLLAYIAAVVFAGVLISLLPTGRIVIPPPTQNTLDAMRGVES